MRLQLFIDGQQADIENGGSEALILWNYTREDAEAPAAVRNSYTKTVTLPATEANAAIFSHIYRPDHTSASGAVFDPLARTPFVILGDNGACMERGYLKLDRVLRRGAAPVSYEVTLYGGVGELLYNLMYRADGSKRTLGDMRWLAQINRQPDERDLMDPHEIVVPFDWSSLYDGTYLSDASGGITFVPVYGGIPNKNFDASKAYYKPGSTYYNRLDGIKTSVVQDGVTYGPHPAANGGVILNLGTSVNDWEAQCLAPENLKTAIHVARVLLSIEEGSYAGDFGEWRLRLQGSWWSTTNPNWWSVWMTIPKVEGTNVGLDSHLTGTMSPADLLLGYAKMFGLVFHPDPVNKVVYLMTREEYYANGQRDMQGIEMNMIDLSDRIDGEDVEQRPFLMDARVYDFSVPTAGAFAEEYKSRYGRTYGDFRLDTRYTFDDAVTEVMRSLPFNGCVDAEDRSAWYFTQSDTVSEAPPIGNYLKFSQYSEVTYLLYNAGATKSIKMTVPISGQQRHSYSLPALPQFHDASGRPTNSDNVLLYYLGEYTLPVGQTISPVRWHRGSYNNQALTGGKDVWNISPSEGVTQITSIPWFRRWWDQDPFGQPQWELSLDFGTPNMVAVQDYSPSNTACVFYQRWRRYLSDRFNRDTVVFKARVDLSGLQVDASLLRRFFWYRGAYWSLNRITDYCPARTGGMTECEFVRVHDLSAYTGITQ